MLLDEILIRLKIELILYPIRIVITKVLLILPPFTQLNTPYPSIVYLNGFLKSKNILCEQADLGMDVVLEIFSKKGLTEIFNKADSTGYSENAKRILALKENYIQTIDEVISFLQYKNPALAHAICSADFLPKASRFSQQDDLEWCFGTMGIQDQARYLATLYLDDLSDFIVETCDADFGFSRYAEKLGRCANTFDELNDALIQKSSFIMQVMEQKLKDLVHHFKPDLIAISVPFPGNLFGAFKCGQVVKRNFPQIKIAMGGGFPNTELRSISDARVFDYVDYITLDDGEAPILNLIELLEGNRDESNLKRTFHLQNGAVIFTDNSETKDFSQNELPVPDYSGLNLKNYLSVIEMANPMHSLWSNGRWNKLTLAHGCYWAKCTFCDVSLDYIKRYDQTAAPRICDNIEELIRQTGENGFHFVDEAAPPALLRDVAIEIIRRKLNVVWWTNIRFEKSFTADLCRLLKASGCIAMSGGLEVASDRLLKLIDKGVTVEQVTKVCRNFSNAGILVHAYLMYGYPTQTKQETVDSLEMVRQLFESGIIQSGFWHRFAMTAHSPVGMKPEMYQTKIISKDVPAFANNDLEFDELLPVKHEMFSEGLRKSLYNYMRGVGFDIPLQKWFEEKIPVTKINPDYIQTFIDEPEISFFKPTARLVYNGVFPVMKLIPAKSGKEQAELTFISNAGNQKILFGKKYGEWLMNYFEHFMISSQQLITMSKLKEDFEKDFPDEFDLFWISKSASKLREIGLLVV